MIDTNQRKILLFSMLLTLACSVNTINAKVDDYTKTKLFAKYQHTPEETCKTAQCANTEKCLELLITKINNNYAGYETNSLSNLEQDAITLHNIKKDAWYLFWPADKGDVEKIKQANRSLQNIQHMKDFLQHHVAYMQAKKITQLYQTMPLNNEAFKTWATQKFSTSHEPAIINCKHDVQAALATIDHFSTENKAQYPQLYLQLSSIRNNINKMYPMMEALYQTASEQQKQEQEARKYRELHQQRIEAQNRASQAMELQAKVEQEKIQKIHQLIVSLTTFQLHTNFQQFAYDIHNKQHLVNTLQQLLDNKNTEEQRLLRELSTLQTMLQAGSDYAKLSEKKLNLEKAIEKNTQRIQNLREQQNSLQQQIGRTTIPSQREYQNLRQQVAQQEQQLREQQRTINSLNPEVPVATPYSGNSSYPQAEVHCMPEPSAPPAQNPQRQPAYNPNHRCEHPHK